MKLAIMILAAPIYLSSIKVSYAVPDRDPRINCTHPNGGYEESYCASKMEEADDFDLNSAYKNLKDRLTPNEARKLVQIESKWIALRDEICDFETSPATGATGWQVFHSECISRLTKNRIIDLKSAIDFRK